MVQLKNPRCPELDSKHRVQVHGELVEIVVGEVVDGAPLAGVGGKVLVGGDQFAVGEDPAVGPDVQEVVGGAREMELERHLLSNFFLTR